jgi:predicted transcriptional regulator
MAGRKAIAITDRQFEALKVLWARGPLTVRELLEHLPGGSRQPYTTVLGLLQTMEKAGLVEHDKENQAHRYRPTLDERQATRRLLGDFLGRFFRGSAAELVLGLVDAEQLSAGDLKAIEAKLRAREAGDPPAARPGGRGRRTP